MSFSSDLLAGARLSELHELTLVSSSEGMHPALWSAGSCSAGAWKGAQLLSSAYLYTTEGSPPAAPSEGAFSVAFLGAPGTGEKKPSIVCSWLRVAWEGGHEPTQFLFLGIQRDLPLMTDLAFLSCAQGEGDRQYHVGQEGHR